jgi:hypothetical protein
MAYTVAQLITAVRSLVNESSAAFFTDPEVTDWLAQATLEISTLAKCVEAHLAVQMLLETWEYVLPADCVEVLHAIWDPTKQALRRVSPSMVGEDSPDLTGDRPVTFFEWNHRLYLNPLPNGVAADQNVHLFYARVTADVLLLPDTYQVLAISYAVYRAKLKDHLFTEAATLYAEYATALVARKLEIQRRLPHTEADLHLASQTLTGGARG